MGRLLKATFVLGLVAAAASGAGFLTFADGIRRLAPAQHAWADAIVVLTGDEDRIATGMKLMMEGRGRRLLISGVHPATKVPSELKRRIKGRDGEHTALVRCCVDIGHEALNTGGNADETRQWAREHGFGSLILVTSSYHVPRSLVEFERALPAVRLVAHPVPSSRALHLDAWWRHWPTARLLAGEYVKYLGSRARLALSRALPGVEGSSQPVPAGAEPPVSLSARPPQ